MCHLSLDGDAASRRFESHVAENTIEHALRDLRAGNVEEMHPAVEEQAVEGLKFSACLPMEMAIHTLRTRLRDGHALRAVLEERVRKGAEVNRAELENEFDAPVVFKDVRDPDKDDLRARVEEMWHESMQPS